MTTLTKEELAQLPNPFLPVQARAVAAVESSRYVVVLKKDGTERKYGDDEQVYLEEGDEVLLVPKAEPSPSLLPTGSHDDEDA